MSSEHQVLIADDDADFAACIARLLADSDLGELLSCQAREYVVREHSWASVASRYLEVYQQAIESSRRETRTVA